MTLTFDADKHQYLRDGVPLPSVTQIIGQYVKVRLGDLKYLVDTTTSRIFPAEEFDDPADLGTAIHKGAAILQRGQALDWASLDERLTKPLEQFQDWMTTFAYKPLLIEEPMASAKWGYAGTPDMVGTICGTRYLIDIKTGALGLVGPQTAAYLQMYREHSGYTGKVIRAALHLPKDGSKPKLKEQAKADDWAYFKARLTCHCYQRGEL